MAGAETPMRRAFRFHALPVNLGYGIALRLTASRLLAGDPPVYRRGRNLCSSVRNGSRVLPDRCATPVDIPTSS
jgi:hypothetical protein